MDETLKRRLDAVCEGDTMASTGVREALTTTRVTGMAPELGMGYGPDAQTAHLRAIMDAAVLSAGMGYGATPQAMATQGVKFDADKPRMDLLDAYAIEQLALVLSFGAKKYDSHNWRKGIAKGRLIAAALRHLFAYLRGEDKDAETGLSHAAHAMCCCMFLLGLEHRADLDDRWKEAQQ